MSNRRVPVRIAYFAEGFPTLSETWINSEIRHLSKLGAVIKVFSTRMPSALERRGNLDLTQLSESLAKLPMRLDVNSLISNFPYLMEGLVGSDANTARLRAQVFRDYVAISANIQKVQAFNPDFLLAHFGGRRATLAMMASAALKVPFGIKYHAGNDVFTASALEKAKIERAHLLMTISRYNLDVFESRGVDTSRFQIHRCGIDVEEFVPPKLNTQRSEIFRIVSVGRLVPMKGFDDLLFAIKILHSKGAMQAIPTLIDLIGGGPLEAELRAKISELSLNDIVRLQGPQESAVVRRALSEASLFVLACKAIESSKNGKAPIVSMDGIPVALMEAMASCVPVVSTKVSGIPELVGHDSGGWLVPPSNPSELATAIYRAMSLGHEKLAEIGRQGRRRVTAEFDAATLAEALFENIQKLIADR